MGRWLAWLERALNKPKQSFDRARAMGVLALVLLLLVVALLSFGVHLLLGNWVLEAVFASSLLACRSLWQHVQAIATPLQAGDVPAAREALSHIVGRDTTALDETAISRAALESLSESLSDGVVAPAFWGLIFGLPGMAVYKAINTADSMIGHKDERYLAFGWAAARLDDAANFIPARITALLIVLASGGALLRSSKTLRSDARKHASPNAGWPEAAMAGALGVQLGGPVSYDGIEHAHAWLGQGGDDANAADVARGLRLYARACGLFALLLAGLWALLA